MKNKILVVALIAAALTAGLVLAGCHKDCPRVGEGETICKYDSSANSNIYPLVEIRDCEDRCISGRIKESSVTFFCDC